MAKDRSTHTAALDEANDCAECGVGSWLPARSTRRLFEGHLGMRFGDARFNVHRDGVKFHYCIELVMWPNGDGEALCYVHPHAVCGDHLRREIVSGNFSVKASSPREPAPQRSA